MGYPDVTVDSPTFQGVRVDHERIQSGILRLLELGYDNEYIMRVIGSPQEVVTRARHRWEKEKREKNK